MKIKEGTTGLISYKADKYGKFITRPFLWDNKCLFTTKHVIYFDTFRNNYRSQKFSKKTKQNYKSFKKWKTRGGGRTENGSRSSEFDDIWCHCMF